MSYCVTDDVSSEFKSIEFNSDSPVTDDKVTEFIAQADAFIDGKLTLKYATPITGAKSLLTIKTISIWLVADRVSKILQVKSATESTNTAEKSLRQMALDLLKDILDGKFSLSDATPASTGSGFKSYANDNDLDYTFHSGTDEW